MTALTLALVSAVVINRLDDFTRDQVRGDLQARALTVRDFAIALVAPAAGNAPVIESDGSLNPAVRAALGSDVMALFARIAQADVTITLGTARTGPATGTTVIAAPNGTFTGQLTTTPAGSQTRDADARYEAAWPVGTAHPYGIVVSLSGAYTFRATTLAQATTLLVVLTIAAVGLSALVAIVLARRFTTPIRRLTDAARGLAEGDLTRRVELEPASAGTAELAALAQQFNTMAARLEESVAIIRRDRDRSRDFLADVSHELRTPIAALRTFVELLQEGAGNDPEARREFLDASAGQLERLDWLAQNLLELSKLESGLVLLDLRPEDLRAAVESAVEQADPTARKRGIDLRLELPSSPLRIRHDPQRIGQVVGNLIGNAIKFTERGGHVRVTLARDGEGALLVVADTGVGIDRAELPRIFERFYRGSQASEARGSGSGLGLAIVKSIVDMHRGRISVDSRVGAGTTFRVWLPADPRQVEAGSAIAAPESAATQPAGTESAPRPAGTEAATRPAGTESAAHRAAAPGPSVDVANSSPRAGS